MKGNTTILNDPNRIDLRSGQKFLRSKSFLYHLTISAADDCF